MISAARIPNLIESSNNLNGYKLKQLRGGDEEWEHPAIIRVYPGSSLIAALIGIKLWLI